MFFIRDAATMEDFGAYIFGDDQNLTIVPDNSDRITDDMLI